MASTGMHGRPSHMMHPQWLALSALAMASLLSSSARAQDLDLRVGAKGTFTLAGQLEASDPPTPRAPFVDGSWAPGFGGGLYGELHASELLGVEAGVFFERNHLFFEGGDANTDFEQSVGFTQLRVPILAKLFLQASDSLELSAGLGPVLVLGLGASTETQLTRNRGPLSDENLASMLDYFHQASDGTTAALMLELGISFYTLTLHIPIGLRFSYNLGSGAAYADRVTVDETLKTQTFSAVETLHFGVVVGLGFLIPPREPPEEPKDQTPDENPFMPFR